MVDTLVPLNGHVRIRAWEKQPDGTEKEVYDKTIKNLIVDAGKVSILKFLGNLTGGGYVNGIGVGDSTTAASSSQTDLIGTKYWKDIATADRIILTTTLYVSVDFGYTEGNFTWNELGLRDNQGSPVLIARQIDSTPFVKTSAKRAIVEWQLSL